MKVALLSDIHGNLEALRACLAHARAAGAGEFAFLGDLVGYGADPQACLEIVREHVAHGAIAVMGNHDEAAATGRCETMNFVAAESIYWTRAQLAADDRAFLEALPREARKAGELYRHSGATRDGKGWEYVTDPRSAERIMNTDPAPYLFVGHVHEPALYFRRAGAVPRSFRPTPGAPIPAPRHRQWLAIAGSVGQPRDGATTACYLLFDRVRESLNFQRVPYDHLTAASKIRAAGLPERLALRVEHGS